MKFEPTDKRLAQVVAAYGADPHRWPEGERQGLLDIAAIETGADWMADARALDRALDRGMSDLASGEVDPDLVGVILARAEKTPQIMMDGQTPDRRPIDISTSATVSASPRSRRFTGFTDHLPEVAVLAASLLIGIWVGGYDVINAEITEFGQVAGLSISSEDESNLINALIGIDLVEDEDLL